MKLEQQAIENLYDLVLNDDIGKELYSFFQKEIYPVSKEKVKFIETIEYCLYNTIEFKEIKSNLLKNDIKRYLVNKKRTIKQKIKRVKTSFANKVSSANGLIQNDIKGMFSINQANPNTLLLLYNTTNPDEYIKNLLEKQKKWLDNNDLLTKHPYVSFAGEIKNEWYYLDLAAICLEYILEDDSNFINFSSFYANDLIDMPFFSPSSTSIPASEIRYETSQALETQAVFNINENSEMIIQSAKDDEGNIIQVKRHKTLDSKDFEILGKAFTYIDNDFIKTRTIDFNIVNIAKAVFNVEKLSKKHYQIVIERLHYIYLTRFYHHDAIHNQTKVYNLIDEIFIDHNLNMVKIKLGETIMQNFLNKKLTVINNKLINNDISPFAKRLGIILQKERVIAGTSSEENYIVLYNYSYFKSKFIFVSKSFRKNWQMIIEALDELKTNKTIIDNYAIKPDNTIEVHFKKLTASEIADLEVFEQNILDFILEEPQNN